jgi:F0F1-type ATP synthase alpha subunit
MSLEKVHSFEEALIDYMNSTARATRDKLAESLSFKGLEDEFNTAIKEFKATFG